MSSSYRESGKERRNRLAAEARLSDEGKKYFRFIEFDENETLITEIRKHPAGMYIIMLTGALVALALFTIGIFGAVVDMVDIFGDELNGLRPFLVSISLVMIFGTAVAVYIAIFLYKSNVIYLTNEKIAQVVYLSLFNRKISQLSIGDVQDVTVMQKGVYVLPITVTSHADVPVTYSQIINYIAQLESSRRTAQVTNISISRNSKAANMHNFTININTYVKP